MLQRRCQHLQSQGISWCSTLLIVGCACGQTSYADAQICGSCEFQLNKHVNADGREILTKLFVHENTAPYCTQMWQRFQCGRRALLSLNICEFLVLGDTKRYLTLANLRTIEGKNADTDLAKMPDNLFDAMSELTTIHIGSHRYLKVLPRLDGLRNLNDLSLATLPLLDDLPDFSKLNKLQRVEFIQLTALKRLPDFHADVSLSSFAVALSRPCCNGFLEGCDFSLSACIGMNPDSCMSSDVGVKALSEETQKQFYTHRSTICTTDELLRGVPKEMFFTSITKDQVDICQGMLSRECSVDNLSAGHSICYNERFQVIHCVKSDYAIEMRRQEIRQGVGDSCDPVVEAWLGCRPSALDYLFQAAR